VRSAFLSYASDYSYVTGANAITGKGYCGCPGGSAVSCSNCPVDFPYSHLDLCVAGNHQDSDCPLNHVPGVSGTYCFKLDIYSGADIQVNHFQSAPSLEIEVDVDFNGTLWYGEFDGVERTIFHLSNGLNITLSTAAMTPVLLPEFAVWHYETLPDFYLLNNGFVNSLDSCDPTKIGWIKAFQNNTQCSGLLKDGDISVQSCNDNSFKYTYTAVDSLKQLTENLSQYKASKIAPGSVLADQHFNLPYLTNQTFDLEGAVKTGFALVDEEGFKILGFDFDGDPVPQATVEWTATYRPSTDLKDDLTIHTITGKAACSISPIQASNGSDFYIVLCKLLESSFPISSAFILTPDQLTEAVNANFDCALMPTIKCNTTAFTVNQLLKDHTLDYVSWPDYGVRRAIFSGGIYLDSLLNQTYVSNRIFMPITTGSLAFKIAFSGLTINYETSSTKPMIDNIEVDNDEGTITVYAHTLTTPGRCYIVAKPALNFPIPVDLTSNSLPTKFNVQTNLVKGTFDLRINCANYVASKSYEIDYADETVPINSTTVSSFGTVSGLTSFWNWGDWSISTPFQRAWKILTTIGLFVVGILLFVGFIMFLGVIWRFMPSFRMFKRSYKPINSPAENVSVRPRKVMLKQFPNNK
jgi:hypothetical protein